MTYTELVEEASTRLNLTTAAALARIGHHVNRAYRKVRTSCGMLDTARVIGNIPMAPGVRLQTFESIERVISIIDMTDIDENGTPRPRALDQVTYEELLQTTPRTERPQTWAVARVGSHEVQVLFDFDFTDGYTLQIEGEESPITLADDAEPDFPEAFHDILVDAAMMEELYKQEKPVLAREFKASSEDYLKDLRYYLAVSSYKDIVQGKRNTPARMNPFRRVGGTGL